MAIKAAGKAAPDHFAAPVTKKKPFIWIGALLGGKPAPMRRTLKADVIDIKAEIVTDACPFGIGRLLRVDGKVVECFTAPICENLERKFKARKGESKWNTLWEAVALLTAARLWLPALGYGATVHLKSDNLATIQMIVKGKAKSAELNVVAREFAMDFALLEYRINWISHIFGATNIGADALSRQFAPCPKEIPDSVKHAKRRELDFGHDFWKVPDLR